MAGMLRHGWGRGASEQQGEEQARHAPSPSIGRTVTTRIMPACMW